MGKLWVGIQSILNPNAGCINLPEVTTDGTDGTDGEKGGMTSC